MSTNAPIRLSLLLAIGLAAGLALGVALIPRADAANRAAPTQATQATQAQRSQDGIESVDRDVAKPQPSSQLLRVGSEVYVGSTIAFEVSANASLGEGAWVGLVPSSIDHGDETVNDAADVDYVYVESGKEYALTAPVASGRYDLRLHDRFPGGVEIDFAQVVVLPRPKPRPCKCKRQRVGIPHRLKRAPAGPEPQA